MCGSLICTNITIFPVLEGANSRFTDNFYSQDSKVECVRTMFSVSYGSQNPAFVTDGTKCGHDKVSGLIFIFLFNVTICMRRGHNAVYNNDFK